MRKTNVTAASFAALLGACSATPGRHDTTPRIVDATFLPEIHGEGAAAARVLYQDGALPTPVPGGTLWSFGDTFLGTRNRDGSPAYTGALSNTLALLPAGSSGHPPALQYVRDANGIAASPLQLEADEDPKTRRLWPLAGVWLDNRAYMFFGLIDVTGPGPWGFRPVGTGLAVADAPLGPYRRLRADGGASWGIDPSSIHRDGPWLYLYAPRRFHGEADPRSGLLVARINARDIEDPTRCEFLARIDGGEPVWVPRIGDAAAACDDVYGQASVAWNAHLGAFVLATSSNFARHDGIRLRVSTSPWGPWRDVSPDGGWITVPERAGEKTQLIYCAMLHPELDEENGRLVTITFCRMLTRDWAFTNPEVVRIEFAPR